MRIYPLLLTLLLLASATLFGQGIQVDFGKNRVQYHQDFAEWSQYESDNFVTYWYGESRFIGQSVVQLAELDFNEIQNVLEHRINEKIQIIVYADLTDVKQSNIGSEDTFVNAAGQTKIVGNKVFVYFNGDHNDLRRQVREGIASVYLNEMLFGSNLQEIVQNAVMMNLPAWFKEGLVGYVGERWNPELDNQLRDYILSDDFEGFDALAERDPKLAGHSLWYFIGESYGRSQVSNLLYLTRINRSIENGFLYVLGTPYEIVGDRWAIFFRQRYEAEAQSRDSLTTAPIGVKNKRNLPITQARLSPDGNRLLYVVNEIGRYKIYLYDINKGESELLLKEGFRNAFQATDYNYPHVAWSPNGNQVAIMYERRDVAYVRLYDVLQDKYTEEPLSTEFQRVYSMEYINPITLVLSAAVRGQSDIFLYYTNTRQSQRITRDYWDDLDASYVKVDGQEGILFASNRPDTLLRSERLDTIMPIGDFDIFYYDLTNRSDELVRITNTPFANERNPVGIDTTWFAYLSDRSGIFNRETGYLEEYLHHYDQIIYLEDGSEIRMHADSSLTKLDSTTIDTIVLEPIMKKRAITRSNTNFGRSILSQSVAQYNRKAIDLVLNNNRYQIYQRNLQPERTVTMGETTYQDKRSTTIKKAVVVKPKERVRPKKDKPKISPDQTVLIEADEVTADTVKVDESQRDTGKVDIDNYLFQSEFDDEEEEPTVIIIEEDKEDEQETVRIITGTSDIAEAVRGSKEPKPSSLYEFKSSKIIPYRLEFRTDFVTTQLDNSLLFDGLNSFAANPDGFNLPNPGILMKANFKDLFEDYEFEGGVRVPTTFNGTEYFLTFKDKKRRLDRQYSVYRRNQRFSGESQSFVPNRREVNILLGQYGLRYPFDIFRSLRATGTLRRDRVTQLATERSTLEVPTRSEERAGVKLEYVFDNTLDVALNIKNGSRYKVYAEVIKKFNIDLSDGAEFDFARGAMGIVGFDARHYQRFLKHSVIALRAAGATSFGSERMIYFLGGVDNWLFNTFNNEVPIPDVGSEIAFQALATNMRGFDLNIRNGSSYLLSNIELRMPIFKYFSKRVRSPFFRNFQLVGFFDVGTAWEGRDPFSEENPLNTDVIDNGELVSVKVNYFRDPVVAGYGGGVRALLFGYFVRLDYAWGIETRVVQDPIFYLSIGTDF